MKSLNVIIIIVFLFSVAGFLWTLSFQKSTNSDPTTCTTEVLLCPDGTTVGRTGAQCEFAKCPVPVIQEETESTTSTLNKKILQNGVYITPLEIFSDSRCPTDVTCIWAGTVTIRALLASISSSSVYELTLGESITFDGKQVTLVAVTPAPSTATTIAPTEYTFEFSVTELRNPIELGLLSGTMNIGPICPVERIENPCLPTPEMFEAHKIAVYESDKRTLITTITAKIDGTFSLSLPAGIYYTDMLNSSPGPGGVTGVPRSIEILSGENTNLHIDIDTGIR